MKDVIVISYPESNNDNLLSLTEGQSRYLLPFACRYRVVDFTLSNVERAKIKSCIFISPRDGSLKRYVASYAQKNKSQTTYQVVYQNHRNLQIWYDYIKGLKQSTFIICKGDTPTLLDFEALLQDFSKKRCKSVVYKLSFQNKCSFANTVVVTNKQELLTGLEIALAENDTAPDLYAMIINLLITKTKKVKKGEFPALFWNFDNVTEYYQQNFSFFKSGEVFRQLTDDFQLKTLLQAKTYAWLGESCNVDNCFLADGCQIDGEVSNSMLFPGVKIAKGAVVKDSLILPFCQIAEFVRLERTIVDEQTMKNEEESFVNLSKNVAVGTGDDLTENEDYPEALQEGISLVGKNCQIPASVTIGAGCYVVAGTVAEMFTLKEIEDGKSLEGYEDVDSL